MRAALSPRLTDATILVMVVLAVLTGLASLVATPADWWVFVLHGAGALTLVALLVWKLRRVRPRISAGVTARSGVVVASIVLTVVAVAALATGIAWTTGLAADLRFRGWTLLNLHIGIGLLVVPILAYHLTKRFRTPTRSDWEGRRSALQYAGLAVSGALAWKATQAVGAATGDRRFTGSQRADGEGNDFPVTSWVLDDPDPIDPDEWSLYVDGLVETPLQLSYAELPGPQAATDAPDADTDAGSVAAHSERAILDCTSGWYADREWQGVRVGELLDRAEVAADARRVVFHSVTGYRFDFPVEEARDILLATGVGGERLTHGHGFPMRVVAPDRRGFQWVKWVTAVEVRHTRDWGSWIAIFLSGV